MPKASSRKAAKTANINIKKMAPGRKKKKGDSNPDRREVNEDVMDESNIDRGSNHSSPEEQITVVQADVHQDQESKTAKITPTSTRDSSTEISPNTTSKPENVKSDPGTDVTAIAKAFAQVFRDEFRAFRQDLQRDRDLSQVRQEDDHVQARGHHSTPAKPRHVDTPRLGEEEWKTMIQDNRQSTRHKVEEFSKSSSLEYWTPQGPKGQLLGDPYSLEQYQEPFIPSTTVTRSGPKDFRGLLPDPSCRSREIPKPRLKKERRFGEPVNANFIPLGNRKSKPKWQDRHEDSESEVEADDETEPDTPLTRDGISEDPDDTWWINSFPEPWNMAPRKAFSSIEKNRPINVKGIPKFAGESTKYLQWRNSVLYTIHGSPTHWLIKLQAILETLDPNVEDVEYCVPLMPFSPLFYSTLIHALEERFGGKERTILQHRKDLKLCPSVKQGDANGLRNLNRKLKSYMDILSFYKVKDIPDSEDLFMATFEKLPPAWRDDFLRHVDTEDGATLISLSAWMKKQIKLAQKCDLFVTLSAKTHEKERPEVRRKQAAKVQAKVLDNEDVFMAKVAQEQTGQEKQLNINPTKRSKSLTCTVCSQLHGLQECPDYLKMSLEDRRKVIRDNRHCYNCLSLKHFVPKCKAGKCTVKDCDKRHHSTLHYDPTEKKSFVAEIRDENDTSDTEHGSDVAEDQCSDNTDDDLTSYIARTLSLQSLEFARVKLTNTASGCARWINVILDSGSTAHFLEREVAKELKLDGLKRGINLQGITGKSEVSSQTVKVRLQSRDGKTERDISMNSIHNPVGEMYPVDWVFYKDKWPHLQHLNIERIPNEPIRGIIGVADADLIASLSADVIGQEGEPTARETALGWVIAGRVTPGHNHPDIDKLAFASQQLEVQIQTNRNCVSFFANEKSQSFQTESRSLLERKKALDNDLNELVKKWWEITAPPEGDTKSISREEKHAIRTLKKKVKRLPSGRYQAPALWRPGEPTFPNSKPYCLARHSGFLKSHLMQSNTAKKEVTRVIQEDWKDFVEPATSGDKEGFYVPIFAVKKSDRDTTKYRVVVDGAAKGGYGKSLNDAITSGPCMITDVLHPITRFRRYKYFLMGDVSQMFLQIELDPDDRRYHKFLYSDELSKAPVSYQFRRHCFGNAGSPAVAIYVLKHHAEKFLKSCPEAASSLIDSTHVDDTVDSYPTEETTARVAKDIIHITDQACLPWRKILSNSEEVMKGIPTNTWASGVEMLGENIRFSFPNKKILGLRLLPQEDAFTFPSVEEMGLLVDESLGTKREILSTIARPFDPCGFIAPVLAQGKLLLQECWKQKTTWDERPPEPILKEWTKWLKSLEHLPSVRVPRVLLQKDEALPIETNLHTFCDASGRAYGFVSYVTNRFPDGEVTSNILMSKSKLAPIKGSTIPRLELEAATLAAKCVPRLASTLNIQTENCHYWTDSTNVLAWIQNGKSQLRMYVANRVETISDHTTISNWRHVSTLENPADLVSRGCTAETLIEEKLWWNGPKFIHQDGWKKSLGIAQARLDEEGQKEIRCFHANRREDGSLMDPQTFSSWKKLKRRMACLLWATDKWKSFKKSTDKEKCIQGPDPSKQQWERAEAYLIKREQEVQFQAELESQDREGHLKKTGKLKSLRPLLDKDGLIRINSRTVEAKLLDYDVCHPLVLAKKSHLTDLIVDFYHQDVVGHSGGPMHTLHALRTRFWIVGGGKDVVKKRVGNCVQCLRIRTKPMKQEQAPLPSYRVPDDKMEAPFTNTNVDAAGPFEVKILRKRAKRYLIIFTCMKVRAVHIEVVEDLSQDAFMMAFDRFTSRRGMPLLIRSDNGGNFVGARTDFMEMWREKAKERALEKDKIIQWILATPRAPHTQGSVERMVQLVKRGLYANLSGQVVTDGVLATLTVKVEGILNSRPLTTLSTDAEDLQVITPNHFLIPLGQKEGPTTPEESAAPLQKMWTQTNQLLKAVWNEFKRTLIPELHRTSVKAWNRARPDIREGDIVCLLEDKEKGRWPLARVIKTHRTPTDGKIRSVTIQMAKPGSDPLIFQARILRRNITSLMLISKSETGGNGQEMA